MAQYPLQSNDVATLHHEVRCERMPQSMGRLSICQVGFCFFHPQSERLVTHP